MTGILFVRMLEDSSNRYDPNRKEKNLKLEIIKLMQYSTHYESIAVFLLALLLVVSH